MSDIAIRCEGLSKQYKLGERESYKALRDVITDSVAAPIRRLRSAFQNGNSAVPVPKTSLTSRPSDRFWALDDVSFEVKRGEVVGIIGRNGAGKSTLLKILSRITKPTRGHAAIHGRVGSLLEIGTGFHPELSGRENIYLNAAILGMRKAEVERKFDEIVDFAEVETFIDTPVKRYSSGMYVRLAFAVAAHMDTEILLVDEVLAVGDMAFQKKCLGKMGDVAKQHRTVVFVSHNMAAVQRLCQTSVLLHGGRKLFQGPSDECVRQYANGLDTDSSIPVMTSRDGNLFIKGVRLLDRDGKPTQVWQYGHTLTVEVEVQVQLPSPRLGVDVSFYTVEGKRLFGLNSDNWPRKMFCEIGPHLVTFCVQNPGVSAPEIYIDVGVRTAGTRYDVLLQYAAYLSVPVDALPSHALPQDLVTPLAEVKWS
jgi:lipopolysaccharide transport system ATP-binding protein